MSNSELLHDKEDHLSNNLEILKKPKSKFQTEFHESLSNSSSDSHSEDDDIVLSKQYYSDSVATGTTSSRVEEEENDGFRTPTSMDHRIPVAKQCPPAPRKLPKPSLKRKPPCTCRHQTLDLSKEVELLFPTQQKTLSNSHQSTKKVRRDSANYAMQSLLQKFDRSRIITT
ncbi:hypothetical protein SESBI_34190 [Sesbania bispinosa]|nr:hypothetical protein SESBI_34190 [Sesbania bispinosa]